MFRPSSVEKRYSSTFVSLPDSGSDEEGSFKVSYPLVEPESDRPLLKRSVSILPKQERMAAVSVLFFLKIVHVFFFFKLMANPEHGIVLRENKHGKTKYPNSFAGDVAVDWLLQRTEYFKQRTEATEYMQEMMDCQLIVKCNEDSFQDNPNCFYQFNTEKINLEASFTPSSVSVLLLSLKQKLN